MKSSSVEVDVETLDVTIITYNEDGEVDGTVTLDVESAFFVSKVLAQVPEMYVSKSKRGLI